MKPGAQPPALGTRWLGPVRQGAIRSDSLAIARTRNASGGLGRDAIVPEISRDQEPLAAAATSAAKSSDFFSMPSPTTNNA